MSLGMGHSGIAWSYLRKSTQGTDRSVRALLLEVPFPAPEVTPPC